MQIKHSRGLPGETKPVRLSLLGPLEIQVNGQPLGLPARKARALLAYLARRQGVEVSREMLCGLLWGDRRSEQARASLRQTLSSARKAFADMADELFEVSTSAVRLKTDVVAVDAHRFEDLASSEDLSERAGAVELYRGDFLEGFSAIDSEFDRWAASERAALRAVLLRCLTSLIELSEAENRPEEMIAFATRLLREDPLQEHVHRGLMRAYAAQGRYDAALRQLDDLTALLSQDLGVRPEAATLELGRDILKRRQKGPQQQDSAGGGLRLTATETATGPALPKRPSIAVLPFRSLSEDQEAGYFGEGVAEDIIIELSRSSELFVVARQSSFRFDAEDSGPQAIGEALGVRFCLSGSIRRSERNLRISAHLVTCADGQEIWADRYDRELKDVFDIQTEIARTVTATVVGRIASADATDDGQRPGNLQSYDLVLRGLQALHRYTKQDIETAQTCFAEAICLDADYGRAHGLLAIAKIYANWYYGFETDQSRAAELAEKAVQLDARNTKAHCALGMTRMLAGDHSGAGYHFEAALALNSNDDLLLVEYGRYLMYADRAEEGILKIREAMRLNPYHPNWYWNIYGRCLHTLGRYEEAIEIFEKVVKPPFWTIAYLAACSAAVGDRERAAAFRAQIYQERPDFTLKAFAAIFPYQNQRTAERYFKTFKMAGID